MQTSRPATHRYAESAPPIRRRLALPSRSVKSRPDAHSGTSDRPTSLVTTSVSPLRASSASTQPSELGRHRLGIPLWKRIGSRRPPARQRAHESVHAVSMISPRAVPRQSTTRRASGSESASASHAVPGLATSSVRNSSGRSAWCRSMRSDISASLACPNVATTTGTPSRIRESASAWAAADFPLRIPPVMITSATALPFPCLRRAAVRRPRTR